LTLEQLQLSTWIKWLTAALLEHRFVVIKIYRARSPREKYLYDTLCGWAMRCRTSGKQVFQSEVPEWV
jgi:hypothetical protein